MPFKVVFPDLELLVVGRLLLLRYFPGSREGIADDGTDEPPGVGRSEGDEEERVEGARDGGGGVVVLVLVRGGEEFEPATIRVGVARARVEEGVERRVGHGGQPRKDGLRTWSA